MRDSGIGVRVFKSHIISSVATSAARDRATSISNILETAGQGNAKTFASYYNKPISQDKQFAENLLDNV